MGSVPDPAYSQYRKYFEVFLPGFLDQSLVEEAQNISCTFAYRLLDAADAPWLVRVEAGRLSSVSQAAGIAECTFVCEISTLLDIVEGIISGQDAFFAREVDIEGDLELGLSLSTLLDAFFERHPYRP